MIKVNVLDPEMKKNIKIDNTYEKAIKFLDSFTSTIENEKNAISYLTNFIRDDLDSKLKKYGDNQSRMDFYILDYSLNQLLEVMENHAFGLYLYGDIVSNRITSDDEEDLKRRIIAKIHQLRKEMRDCPEYDNVYSYIKPLVKRFKIERDRKNKTLDMTMDEVKEEMFYDLIENHIFLDEESYLYEESHEKLYNEFDIMFNDLINRKVLEELK